MQPLWKFLYNYSYSMFNDKMNSSRSPHSQARPSKRWIPDDQNFVSHYWSKISGQLEFSIRSETIKCFGENNTKILAKVL